MGLARIELKRGSAPAVTPNESKTAEEVEIEESIFAFTKAPDQQVAKSAKGGSTGAKVVLSQPESGNNGNVTITMGDKHWTHDVAAHLRRDTPLEGSPFTMRIEGYWPDFRIENGKPTSVSEQPEQSRGRGDISWPGGSDRSRARCARHRGTRRKRRRPIA